MRGNMRGNMGKTSGKVAGRTGPVRSPMAGTGSMPKSPNLHPSTAANTTMRGISRTSAPIRTPTERGAIVKREF